MRQIHRITIPAGGRWPESTVAESGINPFWFLRIDNRSAQGADVALSLDGPADSDTYKYWDIIKAGERVTRNVGKRVLKPDGRPTVENGGTPPADELHFLNLSASVAAALWVETDVEPIVDFRQPGAASGAWPASAAGIPEVEIMANSGGTAFLLQAGINAADGFSGGGNVLLEHAWAWVFNGASWDRLRGCNVFKTIAAVAITAGSPQAFWTPAAGKKFRLLAYDLGLSVAGSVILKDNTTEILRSLGIANGGVPSPEMDNGILSAAANNVLNGDVSTSGSVSGWVAGTEE